MGRITLSNSADRFGGCDEESFVKGYQKGFDAGWALGFEQAIAEGKREGRREAVKELEERARKKAAETSKFAPLILILGRPCLPDRRGHQDSMPDCSPPQCAC